MNNPRPIKKVEVADVIGNKRRFKVTHLTKGHYESVLAGRATSFSATPLQYEDGRVTESRAFGHANEDTKAKDLIYVYDSLDQAKADALALGTAEAKAGDTRAIFEVLPLGFFRENNVKEGVTMCEAVLVGEKVWEQTLPKPKRDVTAECTVSLREGCGEGYFVLLLHKGVSVAELGAGTKAAKVVDPDLYEIKVTSEEWHNFRVYKKN